LRPALRWLWRKQPDAAFLVLRHRLIHGRFPRLFPPRTMNEKVVWRMLFDRRPILRTFVDKLAVRDFVATCLGSDALLPRLHAVLERAEALDGLDLPERFVAKPSHGSHWVWIQDGSKPLDRAALQEAARGWLATDYHAEHREWACKGVPRRLLIEEYLGQDGQVPKDYKIACFNGRATYVQVLSGHFRDLRESNFDRDWRPIPMRDSAELPDVPIPCPPRFAQMIEVAERLSKGMDFLRVDLCHLEDGLRFGELTVYPSGAQDRFDPPQWDEIFGRDWQFGRRGPLAFQPQVEAADAMAPRPLPSPG
jgi:hypothetical protein